MVSVPGAAFGIIGEAGAEPIGDCGLLFAADCRIDNRQELRAALGPLAAPTATDRQLLLAAWRRWGVGCLDRVIGDFALAAFDAAEQSLVLARDPGGRCPLFYRRDGAAVRFASMPSALLDSGPARHDGAALAARLRGLPLPGCSSYFEGVSRVLPGQALRFTSASMRQVHDWNPSLEPLEDSDAALVERFRALLDAAVAARLAREGPTATHLSSGYDSSAVTATAARLASATGPIYAFTAIPAPGLPLVVPPGRMADERALASETARRYGLRHLLVSDSQPLLEGLRGHARFHQEPAGNAFNLGWWNAIAGQARSLGARVVLTGEAGNLTLSAGGLPVLSDWLRRGEPGTWWRQARAASARGDVRWRGTLFNSIRGDYAKARLRALKAADPGASLMGLRARTGIDERDPTADRRLAEFTLRLRPEHLLNHGAYRPLARAALDDRLPAAVLESRRRGYQGADWFSRLGRESLLGAFEEIAANRDAAETVDLPALRRIAERWPAIGVDSPAAIARFGRRLTDAVAVGLFIVETARGKSTMGV